MAQSLECSLLSNWIDERKQPMMEILPVFIISYNRADMIRRCIAGLKHLNTPLQIIIHDNGSDEPETLALLDQLEQSGLTIYHSHKLSHPDELNNVQQSIADYFDKRGMQSDYIVTDCDIDLSVADSDAINIYRELLYFNEQIQCCGPMLRISDIPREYPLYAHVMNRHIEQFWQKNPSFVTVLGKKVAVQPAVIDTTFAIHKKGHPFTRLKIGLRVYHPYEALHLDWYLTETTNDYHHRSNSNIAHWNNQAWFNDHQNAQLQYDAYKVVETDEFGDLTVRLRTP